MKFSNLLSRADSALLQELIGPAIIRLLFALNSTKSDPASYRTILLDLHPAESLLLSRARRPKILELLRPDEARALLARLSLESLPDPYARLLDLDVHRGSTRATLLLSFFGLTEPESESEPVASACSTAGGYELFSHQRSAAVQVSELLSGPAHRALLHMPTGSGKTRTAMNIVAEHLRVTEPGLVVWLAAAEELCEQAAEEFEVAWGKLGNREVSIQRWWGPRATSGVIPNDGLVVAGLAKVYSKGINDAPWLARLGDQTSLIVFDEAHQAVAPTYRHIVEAMMARRDSPKLLGLTATPGRTWNDVEADERLAEFFSKKKVTLKIPGYANPIEYLVNDGYLARPTYRFIESKGPDLSEAERATLGSQLDVPEFILKRLADDHLRNLYIANEVRALARRHRRIIVFSSTVEHAEMLAVVLRAEGIATRAVTASTPKAERAAAIRWYRQSSSDETRILTNFGVLTTGFDAPKTSAALIARPTRSLVLYSQMIGRALRGERAGGNRSAEIVTVVDTGLPGFRSLSETFANWEDVWQQ